MGLQRLRDERNLLLAGGAVRGLDCRGPLRQAVDEGVEELRSEELRLSRLERWKRRRWGQSLDKM
eukprot:8592382-Alexandrium_andersonii.AAC.1